MKISELAVLADAGSQYEAENSYLLINHKANSNTETTTKKVSLDILADAIETNKNLVSYNGGDIYFGPSVIDVSNTSSIAAMKSSFLQVDGAEIKCDGNTIIQNYSSLALLGSSHHILQMGNGAMYWEDADSYGANCVNASTDLDEIVTMKQNIYDYIDSAVSSGGVDASSSPVFGGEPVSINVSGVTGSIGLAPVICVSSSELVGNNFLNFAVDYSGLQHAFEAIGKNTIVNIDSPLDGASNDYKPVFAKVLDGSTVEFIAPSEGGTWIGFKLVQVPN